MTIPVDDKDKKAAEGFINSFDLMPVGEEMAMEKGFMAGIKHERSRATDAKTEPSEGVREMTGEESAKHTSAMLSFFDPAEREKLLAIESENYARMWPGKQSAFNHGWNACIEKVVKPLEAKLKEAKEIHNRQAAMLMNLEMVPRAELSAAQAEIERLKKENAHDCETQFVLRSKLKAQLAEAEQREQENLEACGNYAAKLAEAQEEISSLKELFRVEKEQHAAAKLIAKLESGKLAEAAMLIEFGINDDASSIAFRRRCQEFLAKIKGTEKP